ncbi:MAG: hypothetical protein ACYDEV_10915 [Acidiferrobacter sp.]
MMRALLLACLLWIPSLAGAWQLALGGGLVAGVLQGSRSTGTATGWDFTTQWSRQPFVAQRWSVDLTIGQFATSQIASGLLERGRIATAALFWERRVPLSYDLRPWWGLGGGIAHIRYDRRLQINAQGYAVGTYAATSNTDATVLAEVNLPLSRSWSVSLVGATTWPTHLSTITLTLLWRLL